MTDTFLFRTPQWLDSVESTSTFLRERQRVDPLPSGSVVAAHHQTVGRGRMGNAWHTSRGRDLTFSFVWSGRTNIAEAGTFSLVCGLGLADCLASWGLRPLCKWPNDLLVGGDKISGILVESRVAAADEMEMVVGIGLNVKDVPERTVAAGRPVASLERDGGIGMSPPEVLPVVLDFLQERINAWMASGFFPLADDYAAIMWGVGRKALVRTGASVVEGTIAGVGGDGRLFLTGGDGKRIEVGSVAALEPPGEG